MFLNGQFTADESDNSSQGLQVKTGEYQLKILSREGQTILEEPVTLKADQTTVVRLPGS